MALDSYVGLGRSGLKVSPFCLGAMNFGEDGGFGCGVEESEKILQTYLDHGGNFVDTANFYTNGHSEAILGDFLAARPGVRDRLVLATKFFGNLHLGDPNGGGASRKAIIGQLEDSLRRLRTDYVDLYWLHNYDWSTPLEETLRTLDDLVTAGRIRYVGFSDTPAWFTAKAHTTALLRGWTPVTALQMEYSLLERTIEGELIPLAQDAGMGVLPWSPLKSGFLSGKYRRDQTGPTDTKRSAVLGRPSEAQFTVIEALASVAEEIGASPAAVALSWVQNRPGVSSTLIGPRTLEHLESNLAGLEVQLTSEQRAALDAVSAPILNFPHDLNHSVGPMLKYAGATVDGQTSAVYPPLLESTARY
ncbi:MULTISPECIES: aldo/keto reductase [unclassified Streptomyces]|jgi:aryl-alcohol dehydrogenase-like predicted oxidoreductase|uniref:aldo/keto reductase n=1 Tax=unclassified Streptomyces TaxID=2593676 RepID=UPI000D363203|nr:aldo/keto reductase [Streptomyces sp. VMFN-G11Ma]PTM93831.1 aryl-alcohol dehydrogenase-like predicted oxidoreductase [Streptomyces sp. VMFN-G11Ma]